MNQPAPHYLLKSEASREEGLGRWRFLLQPLDGSSQIEAADIEPDLWGERLDLLTVVRALESLDQPSWVTLVGCTRYVEQGVLYGLTEWKENGWRWECFGRMVPVRDIDLWQRMDRILQIHRVDCGQRRLDASHDGVDGPHWDSRHKTRRWNGGRAGGKWVKYGVLALAACCGLRATVTSWVRGQGAAIGLAAATTRQ
jgi:ribonuclease HI